MKWNSLLYSKLENFVSLFTSWVALALFLFNFLTLHLFSFFFSLVGLLFISYLFFPFHSLFPSSQSLPFIHFLPSHKLRPLELRLAQVLLLIHVDLKNLCCPSHDITSAWSFFLCNRVPVHGCPWHKANDTSSVPCSTDGVL